MTPTATKYDTDWFSDGNELTTQKGLGSRRQQAVSKASALVAKFKTGTIRAFSGLDRAVVANDLDFLLRFPDAFRQNKSPFCGIAAFVRLWAYDNPEAYVQLAIDLFERGRGRLDSAGRHSGKVLIPSAELKSSPAQHTMSQGDWMVMASIREALNNDFNYEHYQTINELKGGTSRARIQTEFRVAGYSKVVTGDSLIEASRYYEKNWRVVLCIRPWLLSLTEREGLKARNSFDTHAVGLDSEVIVTNYGGNVLIKPFDVWTWGSRAKLPGWEKPISMDTFSSWFYYVAAKY